MHGEVTGEIGCKRRLSATAFRIQDDNLMRTVSLRGDVHRTGRAPPFSVKRVTRQPTFAVFESLPRPSGVTRMRSIVRKYGIAVEHEKMTVLTSLPPMETPQGYAQNNLLVGFSRIDCRDIATG